MEGGRIVIARYQPKPGADATLREAIRDHVPVLRAEGLATDRAPVVMRAKDGTYLEVFEWASPEAIEQAHTSEAVAALWERFESSCEYVSLESLSEASDLFAAFEPIDL